MHMQGTNTQSQDFDFARTLVDSRGGLREYKLVLPHHWQIRSKHIERHLRCVFDHVVDPHGATSGIKTTLVLLDLHHGVLHRTISEMNLALRRKYLLRCECGKIALQWGWEVVMASTVDPVTGEYECSAPLRSVDEFASKVSHVVARVPHNDA